MQMENVAIVQPTPQSKSNDFTMKKVQKPAQSPTRINNDGKFKIINKKLKN